MTPEEIIKGLNEVKAWDPRLHIDERIDAAIAYIQLCTPPVAVVVTPAPVEPETPASDVPAKGTKK